MEQSVITPEVQAALTTLCKLIPLRKEQSQELDINLARTNLRKAQLYPTADLSKVFLNEAVLEEAYLNEVNLSEAKLYKVILDKANLAGAKLVQADLTQTSFAQTDIYKADLRTASGIRPEQIKAASSWEDATYDQRMQARLNLPKKN